VSAGDNGSRELMEKILHDEEHHIDWLEGQLHAIKEMTYENYLASNCTRLKKLTTAASRPCRPCAERSRRERESAIRGGMQHC